VGIIDGLANSADHRVDTFEMLSVLLEHPHIMDNSDTARWWVSKAYISLKLSY
jgi:acyl-coenzyme A synthetase/AMP-(fatty) acid ligase